MNETGFRPAGGEGDVTADERDAEDGATRRWRRSWSQFRQWRECGKSYELDRFLDVPARPHVATAAGKAVHRAIERYFESLKEDR